jgi:hypothetical protein
MRKLTLEEIQRNAARFGGRCLSETYVDSLSLMEWECAAGHRWRAVAHAVRQGHWCKRCADQRLRLPATAVHEVAHERGGKCLAEGYTNSQAKIEWQCGRGHRWRSSFNSVKQGAWCPQCKAGERAESRAQARATRQANGSAATQSTAISQNPPAPSRPYSAPEPSVTSAVAEPIPVP